MEEQNLGMEEPEQNLGMEEPENLALIEPPAPHGRIAFPDNQPAFIAAFQTPFLRWVMHRYGFSRTRAYEVDARYKAAGGLVHNADGLLGVFNIVRVFWEELVNDHGLTLPPINEDAFVLEIKTLPKTNKKKAVRVNANGRPFEQNRPYY